MDFLVEVEPGTPVSYFDVVGMEMELSELIRRKADLRGGGGVERVFSRQRRRLGVATV